MHSEARSLTSSETKSNVHVRVFTAQDCEQWDDFVLAHAWASPFHLIAWKNSIEETFGFRPYYLMAFEGSDLRAVLPLFLVRNVLAGRVLISSPFAVYGGILASTEPARAAIAGELQRLAEELRVQYIELRNAYPQQCAVAANISRYVTFAQDVEGLSSEQLLADLPKKTRNLVRKALKHAFRANEATNISDFVELMARTYHRLGTPCFPRRHFDALVRNFGEQVRIRNVTLDGKVVAGSLNFLFRGVVHNFNACSDDRFKSFSPNNFMYFDLLQWSAQNGFRTFDFGRSKVGSGPYEFKRHWNTTMRELPYEVLLVRRKSLPHFSPSNPKFSLAIAVWQRLPFFATKWLGPRLIRLFP